ncbi:MAG: hypothetical protein IT445_14920 [Phycisphaeraceae bacterium]|nr:hypothetical protein [Phycisphaeraceae bacterium]
MLLLLAILAMVWTAWAAAAILSAISVRKFARRYEHGQREVFESFRPKAAVIVPFKGMDIDLEMAVDRLCNQEYPDYQLLCVVESADDPAYPLLQRELAKHAHRRSQLLIAGPAARNEGQKVHNLIFAIEHLMKTDDGEEVWAFADSDALPGTKWLAQLVGPLGQHWITGVTTGYRWFTAPGSGPLANRVWSSLASVINSSIACFTGYDRYNHAWGGSMAMRRFTAIDGELLERLRGSLSDDYQITHLCRAVGLRIYFVPRCLVASSVDFNARSLFTFAQRQYVITRCYAPRLYYPALLLLSLHVLGPFTAAAALIGGLIAGETGLWILALIAMVTAFIANQVRSSYRGRVVRNAFGPDMPGRLKLALRMDRWLTPLWMSAHLLLMLSGLLTRDIAWRGRRYRIHGPQQVEQLDLNVHANTEAEP